MEVIGVKKKKEVMFLTSLQSPLVSSSLLSKHSCGVRYMCIGGDLVGSWTTCRHTYPPCPSQHPRTTWQTHTVPIWDMHCGLCLHKNFISREGTGHRLHQKTCEGNAPNCSTLPRIWIFLWLIYHKYVPQDFCVKCTSLNCIVVLRGTF